MKKKVLIIHQGAIGDLILSLPAIYTIRTAYPEHHFECMGFPRILCLLHGRLYADSVYPVDSAWVAALYADPLGRHSRAEEYFSQFETVWIFGGRGQTVLAEAVQNATGIRPVQIPCLPERTRGHVIDLQLSALRASGLRPSCSVPTLFLNETDTARAEDVLRTAGVRETASFRVVLHPGSGSNKKNWPLACFTRIAQQLQESFQLKPLVVTGPAEEYMLPQIEKAFANSAAVVLHAHDLLVTAGLLQQCAVCLGNDSGITHLAAAVGTRTVAVFGPTDPAVWGPRGTGVCTIAAVDDEPWPSTETVFDAVRGLLD